MLIYDAPSGYEFPPISFMLDAASVAAYLAATEDDNALYWRDGAVAIVPPLGVAALASRDLVEQVTRQPGSLHTGQELTFHRSVAVGERLVTQARVAASSKRRGFTALIVDVAAVDEAGVPALSGRMTLMVAGPDIVLRADGPLRSHEDVARGADSSALTPTPYAPIAASDLAPGLELAPLQRTPTQGRVDRYAVASGDYNPIHVDRQFAERTPFGGAVAHGMLLLAYVSSALTRAFGTNWIDGGSLKVKFRNPAPVGATVTVQGRVERLEDDAHGVQYALCAVRLDNVDNEALITGDARISFNRQPSTDS